MDARREEGRWIEHVVDSRFSVRFEVCGAHSFRFDCSSWREFVRSWISSANQLIRNCSTSVRHPFFNEFLAPFLEAILRSRSSFDFSYGQIEWKLIHIYIYRLSTALGFLYFLIFILERLFSNEYDSNPLILPIFWIISKLLNNLNLLLFQLLKKNNIKISSPIIFHS